MKLLQTAFALALSVAIASAEYYQLSTYQLNSPEKAAAFDKMMAAGVPALNRAGISEVGVFKARGGDKDGDPNWRYVLSAASSIDTFAEARVALASDGGFLERQLTAVEVPGGCGRRVRRRCQISLLCRLRQAL